MSDVHFLVVFYFSVLINSCVSQHFCINRYRVSYRETVQDSEEDGDKTPLLNLVKLPDTRGQKSPRALLAPLSEETKEEVATLSRAGIPSSMDSSPLKTKRPSALQGFKLGREPGEVQSATLPTLSPVPGAKGRRVEPRSP